MKNFTKNPIGRDIEYVLESNPRVTIIRGCHCKYNCDSTWLVRVDYETVMGGYNSHFKSAVKDAESLGQKLTVNPDAYVY